MMSRCILHCRPCQLQRRVFLQIPKQRSSILKRSSAQSSHHTITVPPLRGRLPLLIGPALFTTAVGGGIYAYSQRYPYDTRDELARVIKARQKTEVTSIREFLDRFTTTQQLTYGIIAANAAVFLIWRMAPVSRLLHKFMLSDIYGAAPIRSMLGSMFSHKDFLHIGFNMYVLSSVSQVTLDPMVFSQIYFTGGLLACLGSYTRAVLFPSFAAKSLGASGAILAMLGYTMYKYPDSRFSIALVDLIIPHSFSAQTAFYSLIGIETCGLFFGWRIFDHAAHLSGLLFGAAVGYVQNAKRSK